MPYTSEFPKGEDVSPEQAHETLHRLSETVLHASERRRRALFERLTAANAEKVAQLLEQNPVFFENKADAPKQILLDPAMAELLPEEFFKNPTLWIESQKNIERVHEEDVLPTGETIKELWEEHYDVSKVKEFSVKSADGKELKVVSKRIEPKELEEVARARRAYEAGIPTPQVLGEVFDRGNVYALFEKLQAINLATPAVQMQRHHSHYSPDYTTNEIEFSKHVQTIFTSMSEEGVRRLQSLWEGVRAVIEIRKVCIILSRVALFEYKGFNDLAREELESLDDKMQNVGRDILKRLGYKDYKDFLARAPLAFPGEKEDVPLWFFNKLDKERKAMQRFQGEWESAVLKEIFGFDLLKEERKLKNLCRKKGIEHKDFAPRNILMLWDFENDRLLPRAKNEPKL